MKAHVCLTSKIKILSAPFGGNSLIAHPWEGIPILVTVTALVYMNGA